MYSSTTFKLKLMHGGMRAEKKDVVPFFSTLIPQMRGTT